MVATRTCYDRDIPLPAERYTRKESETRTTVFYVEVCRPCAEKRDEKKGRR